MKVPSNLDEAVSIIKDHLDEEDLNYIKSESNSSSVHFSFGMHIRNEWFLWNKKSKLVKWFKKEYGIDHADDISGLIIATVWRDVKKQPRNCKELAESYVYYWKKMKELNKKGITSYKIQYNNDGTFELLS
jgi:hypothetical protein